MEDTRSPTGQAPTGQADEILVELYRNFDDKEALDVLLKRYQKPIWQEVYKRSRRKDKSSIDDICQEIFLTITERIGKFIPAGPGSFKAWAYLVALHKTTKANEKLKSQPIPLSERYPEEFPDDLATLRPEPTDYPYIHYKLEKLLSHLEPEDRQLLLLSVEKTAEEIIKIPPFDKYKNPAALRQKTCRLRKYLLTLKKEEEK